MGRRRLFPLSVFNLLGKSLAERLLGTRGTCLFGLIGSLGGDQIRVILQLVFFRMELAVLQIESRRGAENR